MHKRLPARASNLEGRGLEEAVQLRRKARVLEPYNARGKQKRDGRREYFRGVYKNMTIGNKQDELVIITCEENYHLIRITVIWWGNSYNWNVNFEVYTLFWKDRIGRNGGGKYDKYTVFPWFRRKEVADLNVFG